MLPTIYKKYSVKVVHFYESNNSWVMDLLTLGFFVTIFYLLWLGSYPLFTPDEGRYSEVAREMVVTGDYITPRVNGIAFLDKPVLYYWLQAAAIHLFGVNEWALRFFPALFGILGCLATYICGRFLFDRRTALVSSIILASTPLYFVGAHYANLDLEVAVLISCTLLFFITGIQSNHQCRLYFLLLTYISAALAFLTKGLIGIAFPAIIIGLWILLLNCFQLIKKIYIIPGLILFLIIVFPWYFQVQQANPEFLNYFFLTQQITRFLSAGEFNNKEPLWFYIPIILIGFFPWTIYLFQTIKKTIQNIFHDRHDYSVELFLLLWGVVIFIFFTIPHSKMIGYILPVFPPLALLVGRHLSTRWEDIKQKEAMFWSFNFLVFGSLVSGVLLVLPHMQWFDISPMMTPYFFIIACIFFISAIFSFWFVKKKKLLPLFVTCVTCNVLFLLILMLSAPYLNPNTAKPLVTYLKTIIKPEDEVIVYYKFFQDVPVYLEKRVTVVANWQDKDIPNKDNWVRELSYGMGFQKTDEWLINEDTFWQRYESDKRVFVFVNKNYFSKFKLRAKTYFNLGQSHDIILISNRPTILMGKNNISAHPLVEFFKRIVERVRGLS